MELIHKLFRKFHLRRWLIWVRPDRFTNNTFVHTKYDGADLKKWILAGIRGYKQWYQPVDFTIARADVTTPPDWLPKPELNDGAEFEEDAWRPQARQRGPCPTEPPGQQRWQ